MQTKSIVQANANVIRVVNLKKGDVYKRIEETYSEPQIKFGVITGVYNDGEKTFIEALEYKKEWRDVSAEVKVFGGDKDVSIYPTTVEEIAEHFETAVKSLEKDLSDKKKEVVKLESSIENAREFINGEMAKKLTTVDFKEISQGDYNEQKRLREERLAELASE